MREVVIVGAKRTPIGKYLGSLKDVSAVDLGTTAVEAALDQAGIGADKIEDVVAGMVYKAGVKGNPARQIQIKMGIPVEASAVTVDQQCASSMRAFEIAVQQILLGKSDISLAVGIESMSRVPHLLMNTREGFRMGPQTVEDSLLYDALVDAMENYHMGVTAENLAEEYSITRSEQDDLALMSHLRAAEAIKNGKFKDEIVPVKIKTRKGERIVDTDENPRMDISPENLKKLRPVFKKDGTVTSGNASSINDGASAVILMTAEKAKELNIKPLAKVMSTASFGVEPRIMGIGPAYCIPKALKYAGISADDVDYYEINEAFAAQFLAVNRELNLDMDKVNANGSGISLGHPVGCTGLRIIISMIYEMQKRRDKIGVASLCVGGGPSMATVLENIL